MTAEERDRMNLLCRLIQEERDPKMFGTLVAELDDLLATKEECSTSRNLTSVAS
jgi:hypothetical protein